MMSIYCCFRILDIPESCACLPCASVRNAAFLSEISRQEETDKTKKQSSGDSFFDIRGYTQAAPGVYRRVDRAS